MFLTSRKGRSHGRQMVIVAGGVLMLAAMAVPGQALASASPGVRTSAAHASNPATRTSAARASVRPGTQSCNDVEFIGARGSGEKYGPFRGLGAEVNKLVTVAQGVLRKHHITSGLDAVPYPADSVNDLKPSGAEIMGLSNPMTAAATLVIYYEHNVRKYLASISQGVTDTVFDVHTYHNVCPSTVFVLAGYSQGAMVMHQAENKISADHFRVIVRRIAGTLLLGDGNRVPHTKAKEFGTSSASAEGIQTYLTKLSKHPDVLVPKTTANICNAHDIVCNFNLTNVLHFSSSGKVHTSYAVCKSGKCKYESVLTRAATWVANAVVKRLG